MNCDPKIYHRDLRFVVVFLSLGKYLYERRSENVLTLHIFGFFFFFKEQGTHLTLNEHDDDDDGFFNTFNSNKNSSDLTALLPTTFLLGSLQN